jgi:hypothetical protein
MPQQQKPVPPIPPSTTAKAPLRVAIVGLGAIGSALAQRLGKGEIDNVELVAVAARDRAKAERSFETSMTASAFYRLPRSPMPSTLRSNARRRPSWERLHGRCSNAARKSWC